MSLTKTQTPTRVYAILFVGVAAASLAAIFIRIAQGDGMPSDFIAAGRLALSAIILTPIALRGHRAEIAKLTRTDVLLASASGLILAIHFATWVASLAYTSVLISVVLVGTSPLWSALFEVVFLRAQLRRLVAVGLALAFAGGLIIGMAGSGSSTSVDSAPTLGAMLSLAGAVAFAIYLVIGRKLRSELSLIPYIWLVYSFAAIFLLLLVLINGTPITGYTPKAYFMLVLLALVPQLIGHSSFNYSVKYLSATFVGIATQMEPIGSSLAAYFIFTEVPLPL
ncbi:MAG TPA: DMT family transporter, partial [Phototrophicaceae bacterium]|nr:DMT family transporter [Phototrophicaceae bacterium]